MAEKKPRIFPRSVLVWLLTLSAGYSWIIISGKPHLLSYKHDAAQVLSLYLIVLLFGLPALFLTLFSLRIVHAAKADRKALLLLALTTLINVLMFCMFLLMGMNNGVHEFIWPFILFSYPIMFLINRDWYSGNSGRSWNEGS